MPEPALRDRLAEILYGAAQEAGIVNYRRRYRWLRLDVQRRNRWREVANALLASEEWQATEQSLGLLKLIVEESLGSLKAEYTSVPTQYVVEAARLTAARGTT